MTRAFPEYFNQPLIDGSEESDLAIPVGLAAEVYALGEVSALRDVNTGMAELTAEEIDWDYVAIVEAFEHLDLRTQYVLSARLDLSGEGYMTLKALGDDLGVSRGRVHQIEQAALKKLEDLYTNTQAVESEDSAQIPRESQDDSIPQAEQAVAIETWRAELIAKQEQGDVAFVKGSLQKRFLPPEIEAHLIANQYWAALKAVRKRRETARLEAEAD